MEAVFEALPMSIVQYLNNEYNYGNFSKWNTFP
jgi:hypothetical protein